MWDVFVLILAVYNSLMIPFDQAFKPEFNHHMYMVVLEYIVDFVFLIDIFVMFITSYLTNKGQETFDQSEISNNYTG